MDNIISNKLKIKRFLNFDNNEDNQMLNGIVAGYLIKNNIE